MPGQANLISPLPRLLAYCETQVDTWAEGSRTRPLLPVTPQAWSQALGHGVPLPTGQLSDIFDLRRSPATLWRDAEARADALLEALDGSAIGAEPPAEQALARHIDRLYLTLVYREILHIHDLLRNAAGPAQRPERLELPPAAGDDRRHWLLSLGAMEAGFNVTPAAPPPHVAGPIERLASAGPLPHPSEATRGAILVSTHGAHDIVGLLNRVRRRHRGPIILLADHEHAHLGVLRGRFPYFARDMKPIELCWLPWAGRADAPLPATLVSPVDAEVARELVGGKRAFRATLEHHVSTLFADRNIRQVIASDHVSDMMAVILKLNACWNAHITLETHSGLPIGPPFWLPPFVTQKASLHAWTHSTAQAAKKRLADISPHWEVCARPPRSFQRTPVDHGFRKLVGLKGPLRLCFLPTTGHVEFTPDVEWASWLAPARALIADALADGAEVHVRLRQAEGGITLYRQLLAPDGVSHPRLFFSRSGDRSLARFLAPMDAGIEVGSVSSARMIVAAHRLPIFRLGPTRSVGYTREDIFPITTLPDHDAYAALRHAIATWAKRRDLVRKQSKMLETAKGRLIQTPPRP